MLHYQFNEDSSYVGKSVDGVATGEWLNTKTNTEFLAWLAEGNTPNPYIPPPAPPEPTITEKLASVGLTVEDLKTALGLK